MTEKNRFFTLNISLIKIIALLVIFETAYLIRPANKPTYGNDNAPCPTPCRDYQVCDTIAGKCRCSDSLAMSLYHKVCLQFQPNSLLVQCRVDKVDYCTAYQICNSDNKCQCNDDKCTLLQNYVCTQQKPLGTCVPCRQDNLSKCQQTFQICSYDNQCICHDQKCMDTKMICVAENTTSICVQCRNHDFLYNCDLGSQICNDLNGKCQCQKTLCQDDNFRVCSNDLQPLCICSDSRCQQNFGGTFCSSLTPQGTCVQCRLNQHCSATKGQVCNQFHICVCQDDECKKDSLVDGLTKQKVCQLFNSTGTICVQCRNNNHCLQYQTCYQNSCICKDQLCKSINSANVNQVCTAENGDGICKQCRQNYNCGQYQICVNNVCTNVQCLEDNDCDQSYQKCLSYVCVCDNNVCNPIGQNNGKQCTSQDKDGLCICQDSVCGQNTNTSKFCTSQDKLGECVQCRGDTNCTQSGEVCDQLINICVCQDSQCKVDINSKYVCKVEGSPQATTQCVPCRQNSHCSDYQVCLNYQCVCKDQLCFTLYSETYCDSQSSTGQCKTCRQDYQCGPKEVCQENQCFLVECKENNDCDTSYQTCQNISGNLLCVCSNSVCNPNNNGKQCTVEGSSTGQCICKDTLCGSLVCSVPDQPSGQCVQCRNDTACQSKNGQVCNLGLNICVCSDDQCKIDSSTLKVCQIVNSNDTVCVQCRQNSHCQNYQICQNYECKCQDQLCFGINGTYCDKEDVGGLCKQCRLNSNCPTGQYCLNNVCVLGGCSLNTDCDQTYQICSSNKCICNNALCSQSQGKNCTSLTQFGKCYCNDAICPGALICTTRDSNGICVQCNVDNDCGVPGEVCDTTCNLCVCSDAECLSDYSFNNPNNKIKKCKYPDSTNTICVQCRQKSDCLSYQICQDYICLCDDYRCAMVDPSKPFCSLQKDANGVCVQCRNQSQCPGNQVCTTNNLCKQCDTSADCPFGKSCVSNICICNNTVCNPNDSLQGLKCTSQDAAGLCVCQNTKCLSLFGTQKQFCLSQNTNQQKCVECLSNTNCITTGQICDLNSNTCICSDSQCLIDAGAGLQYCQNLGSTNTICVQCRSTSNCAFYQVCLDNNCYCSDQKCTAYYSTSPHIDPTKLYCSAQTTTGTCVQCRSNSQCIAPAYCQNNICKTCTVASDCTSYCTVGQTCDCINSQCVAIINAITSLSGANFTSDAHYSYSGNVLHRQSNSGPDRNLFTQTSIPKLGIYYFAVQIKTRVYPNNIFNFGVVDTRIQSVSSSVNMYGQPGGIIYHADIPTTIQSQNSILYSNLDTVVTNDIIKVATNWNTKKVIFYRNNVVVREVDMLSSWSNPTVNVYFALTIAAQGDQLLVLP